MKISDLKKFIKKCYIIGNQNLLITSEAGLGKSQAVKQCADELGINFIDLRGAYLERPDILGIPEKMNGYTEYYINAILAPLMQGGDGILLLDEINRADTSVINCLMQLCTDRKIDKYQVKGNWLVIAAINPTDEYVGTTELDKALLDRFINLELDYNKEEMITFLRTKHSKSEIFINFLEHSFNYKKTNEIKSNNIMTYISPRKLDTACLFSSNLDDLRHVIGITLAEQFNNYLHDLKPLRADDFKNITRACNLLNKYITMDRLDLVNISLDNFDKDINNYTLSNFIELYKVVPIDRLAVSLTKAGEDQLVTASDIKQNAPQCFYNDFKYLYVEDRLNTSQ